MTRRRKRSSAETNTGIYEFVDGEVGKHSERMFGFLNQNEGACLPLFLERLAKTAFSQCGSFALEECWGAICDHFHFNSELPTRPKKSKDESRLVNPGFIPLESPPQVHDAMEVLLWHTRASQALSRHDTHAALEAILHAGRAYERFNIRWAEPAVQTGRLVRQNFDKGRKIAHGNREWLATRDQEIREFVNREVAAGKLKKQACAAAAEKFESSTGEKLTPSRIRTIVGKNRSVPSKK